MLVAGDGHSLCYHPVELLRGWRHFMRSTLRLTTALLVTLTAGCSLFVPKLETPKLSVVNVEMQKSDLWEQRMKVRMRVVNPNDRPIPVKGLTVTLDVQGEELAHGVSGTSFNVPALGEAEFDMNMTANMAGALLKLLGSGNQIKDEVEYRVKGKLALSEGLMRSIPFEDHGTFRLK
jgi:LEA14-like dessication related protein